MNTAELTTMKREKVRSRVSTWRDWLGIVASIGCAVHCAAMPFVFAYLPAFGLSFLADEAFHKWMALVCFLIAIAAFIPGIRKHGNWLPISIGAFGLAFITFAASGLAGKCCYSCEPIAAKAKADSTGVEIGRDQQKPLPSQAGIPSSKSKIKLASAANAEKTVFSTLAPWITPLGGLLLIAAHLLNRHYGCLCGCCVPTPAAEPAS